MSLPFTNLVRFINLLFISCLHLTWPIRNTRKSWHHILPLKHFLPLISLHCLHGYNFTQNFITQGLTQPTSYLKLPTWMAVGITKLICTNPNPGAFLNLFHSVLSLFETASHFPVAQLKNLDITSVFFFLSHFIYDHTLNQMRSTLKIYLSWCGYMCSFHSWESGGAWFNVIPGIWRVCPPSQMYPEYVYVLLHLPLSKSQSSFIWFFFWERWRTKLANSWYNIQNGRNRVGVVLERQSLLSRLRNHASRDTQCPMVITISISISKEAFFQQSHT